jgi:sterol desaturase/sphingolipid hydroxylase (fatty acid hydroxylase superfamily)
LAARDASPWPRWLTPLLAGSAFALIAIAESRRPLRRRREPRATRTARNLATAGLTAAITSALQTPLLAPLVQRVEDRQLGLLHHVRMPRALRTLLGVLLLDYTLWWWHRANHELPPLWRFHLVHHVDRDLDASTAIRFHFGEMSLSVFYRMAQVRLLGIDRFTLSLWQTLLLMSIAFHHSNLRLAPRLERRLGRWIVTPRMHGIHHSDYRDETDSNWSSLISWWDRLHGTMRLDVDQDAIEIGVPAYQRPSDVTLAKITALPFVGQREDWIALDGTPHPARATHVTIMTSRPC